MIFCRQNQDAGHWEDCKSHVSQDDLKHSWSLVFGEQAAWCLLVQETVLTPSFFQLERSLLSCTGQWVHSVCHSNSWPHTGQELGHQAKEINSLKNLGLCSKKTNGLTSTTSHGKNVKWSKASLPVSPLSWTKSSSDLRFVMQLHPSSKRKRFVMNTHCIYWSEAWGIFCLKRDNYGIKTFKKHQIISCFETYVDCPGDSANVLVFFFCLPSFCYLQDTIFQLLELIHFH